MIPDMFDTFTKTDMLKYGKAEAERAVEADRKIQKYKRKQAFWSKFQWDSFFTLLGFVVVIIAAVVIVGFNILPNEAEAPATNFEIVNDTCFVVNGDTYCATIERNFDGGS